MKLSYAKISFCFLIGLGLFSCQYDKNHQNSQGNDSLNSSIDGLHEILPMSIFNLTSIWVNQNSDTIHLKDLNGDLLVVVMIYTSCKAACPRLVADMREIHRKVNDQNVRYVLVSIDPETDTPERLKQFAIDNDMNTDQWIFLQGGLDDVREFSNVLAVKYKKISPMDFSHSNIITVFDRDGVLVYQQEGLGVDSKEIVAHIGELQY